MTGTAQREREQTTYVCVNPLGIYVIYGIGNLEVFCRDMVLATYEGLYQHYDWRKNFTVPIDIGITNPQEQ